MTTATFVTTKGTFTVQLMPEHAPETVQNFVDLATGGRRVEATRATARPRREPLYPGTIFHRVIDDFMIQGGDPTGTGMGGPGLPVRRRVPARRPHLQPGRPPRDGERGSGHQRQRSSS